MAQFNEAERLEIQETLDFWRNLTRDKCAEAKGGGYIKKREALSYLATYRAIKKLTASPNKDIQQFWDAAIARWDIDFLRYIPVRIKNRYEEYYVVAPISKKKRDAYVNRILTNLENLREIINKGNLCGTALNDRFSHIVSEFYQPQDFRNEKDCESMSLYAMMKAMHSEVKSLCDMPDYTGLDGNANPIHDAEKEFLKKSYNKITKCIQFIEGSCRADNLGSFMEQALSAVRKDHFNPRSSMRSKADYKIFPVMPFLDEITHEIHQLKDRGVFYRHHIAAGKASRYKYFGLSIHSMVCEISGERRSAIITAAILNEIFPNNSTTDHDIRNWLKKKN